MFISLTIACSAFGWWDFGDIEAYKEKANYVRLTGKESGELTSILGTNLYVHDSITLETGELLQCVSTSEYPYEQPYNRLNLYIKYEHSKKIEKTYVRHDILGPCEVYLAHKGEERYINGELKVTEGIPDCSDFLLNAKIVNEQDSNWEFLLMPPSEKTQHYEDFEYFNKFELKSGDIAELLMELGHTSEQRVSFSNGKTVPWRSDRLVGPCTVYISEGSYIDPPTTGWRILRASTTGSKTLAAATSQFEQTDDDTQQANNDSSDGIDPTSIKYDELLGWAWFTDTNWVYSYTNLSWYYMHPTTEGFYVWNANLPDNGWMKLERG